MSTLTHIRLHLLGDGARATVLLLYRDALRSTKELTYREAAWLYGFTYKTMRSMVCRGQIKSIGKPGVHERYVTHQEMRRYLREKKSAGAPRKALKDAQLKVA